MQLHIQWPPKYCTHPSWQITFSFFCAASTPSIYLTKFKKDQVFKSPPWCSTSTALSRQSSWPLDSSFFFLITQWIEEGTDKLTTHLTAVFICTKFPQRHLSLDSPHSTLFVWKPIRLGGDFNGDLWSLGQHVLQLLSQLIFQLGSLLIRAVGVIAGVPLLSIWHREVLWTEGWIGLAATDAAVRSANQKSSSASITVLLVAKEKQPLSTICTHQLSHSWSPRLAARALQCWAAFPILEPWNSTTFWTS